MKYEVTVSANIRTTWEAEDKDEAVRMAEQWTADEYGGLVHKADFIVREINEGGSNVLNYNYIPCNWCGDEIESGLWNPHYCVEDKSEGEIN